MDLYALDKDFNLVTIGIPYDNLQWTRRYYEAGEFQVKLPVNRYDTQWAYIGANDRPELGMIQRKQITGEGDVYILLSGFFCEKMLDDKVIYPEYKSSNEGDTSTGGIYKVRGIENIARNLFEQCKKDLPIELGENHNLLSKVDTVLKTIDNQLGEKIYSFLEPYELSYRVIYDYEKNKLLFEVWEGKDRTQSQMANSYQVFSSEFGNLTNKDITLDDSAYKNYAIIPVMADEDGIEEDTYYLDLSNGGYRQEIVLDMRSSFPDEYTTDAEFKAAILQEASEMMLEYAKVEDVNVSLANNSGYIADYDLGDKCDVILTDIGLEMETRIVEVSEVFKGDGHEVTVGLGNKRIDNIRRAANSR